MEDKGLYVNQKDIGWYELLQKVLEECLTLTVVAPALGVSYRQAKRLKARVKTHGLPGLLHGNRDRAPFGGCEAHIRESLLPVQRPLLIQVRQEGWPYLQTYVLLFLQRRKRRLPDSLGLRAASTFNYDRDTILADAAERFRQASSSRLVISRYYHAGLQ